MWRRAVSGDPWELAQAMIVVVASIIFVSLVTAVVWGWAAASVVVVLTSAACLLAFLAARRRHVAFVRQHCGAGMTGLEAMLAVAATVEDEH